MVTINSAESNRASLRFIKETVWGTTPASGITTPLRITSSGLEASKETEISEEIRADRMIPSIIEVSAMSSGEVENEFAAGTLDPFIEAFLLGAWSRPNNFFQVKGTSVSITTTAIVSISGRDYRDYITVGQYIKLDGFLNPTNNGYFLVSAKGFSSNITTVTVTGTPLTVEAASAYTRIYDAADVLSANTATQLSASNTVDAGSGTPYSGLVPGQKVYIEGLGKETGTIVVTVTDPAEGSTITISDGVNPYVLEVRTNSALVAQGNIFVALSGTEATMAANIQAAVMEQFRQQKSQVSASTVTATVTFTNHRRTGGSISTSAASSFTVTNFSGGTATKGGFFTVASTSAGQTFTTVETLATDTNAGSRTVVVKASHVRNPGTIGSITKQSFTLETGFTDVSKYFVMNGMRCGTFNMSAEAGSIVTASLGFSGRQTLRSSTQLLGGAPYTALDAAGTEVMNATSNVGTITKAGTALTSAIMSIELEGEAGLREQYAVGEKFPAGIGYGRFNLSGNITAYFDSFQNYDDFINHVTTSLSWSFTDADYNTYYFTIPALKITSDPIVPSGIDEDVMEEMEWTAQRDPVLNTQFMVDRFSSVWPFSDAS